MEVLFVNGLEMKIYLKFKIDLYSLSITILNNLQKYVRT
jgi:hypothetical protein